MNWLAIAVEIIICAGVGAIIGMCAGVLLESYMIGLVTAISVFVMTLAIILEDFK